jgi:hypothetical protein
LCKITLDKELVLHIIKETQKEIDMNYDIEKIVTRSKRYFAVGEQPYQHNTGVIANALVTEITHLVGDPALGSAAGYLVKLDDGRQVEVYDFAEVWYAAESVMEGDHANG